MKYRFRMVLLAAVASTVADYAMRVTLWAQERSERRR